MNNLQTLLEQYRERIEACENAHELYDEAICIMTDAIIAGAEEHARLSEMKHSKKDRDEKYGYSYGKYIGYNRAVSQANKLSQKALQQIKDTVV